MEVEGVYNPALRFAFTNITQEDFTSAWDKSPIVVKPGETIELPQYLAVKLTRELVDKIMIEGVKLNEVEYYKKNPGTIPNSYRAPSQLGIPEARKVWEDQICRQLAVDEESPQVQVMRAQIKAELKADLEKEASSSPVKVPTSLEEFADLTAKPKEAVKAPLKTKKIKVA